MPKFVALLRGANVGGQHKIQMARLRSTFAGLGCRDVLTYIQSGNAVFSADASAAALEKRFEQAIERQFGFFVPVIVRSASSWGRYIKNNPFSDEANEQSNRVLLVLSKASPSASAAQALQSRATLSERIVQQRGAIWIHYVEGIGRSKLSPDVLDRCVGSTVTARNWRTVLRLYELTRQNRT